LDSPLKKRITPHPIPHDKWGKATKDRERREGEKKNKSPAPCGNSVSGADLEVLEVCVIHQRACRAITRTNSVAPLCGPMLAMGGQPASRTPGWPAQFQGYPMQHTAALVLPGTDLFASACGSGASSSPSLSLYSSSSSFTSAAPLYRPAQIPPLDATLRQNDVSWLRTTCSQPSAGKEPQECCLVFAVRSRRDIHSPGTVD